MTRMFGLTLAACAAILALWAYTSRSVQPLFSASGVADTGDDILAAAGGADR